MNSVQELQRQKTNQAIDARKEEVKHQLLGEEKEARHESVLQEIATKVAASFEERIANLSEDSVIEYYHRLRRRHGLEPTE
jgi:hypothetical protein